MLRLVCATFLFVAVCGNEINNNLYSTYTLLGEPGKKGFFELPRTEEDAKAAGWVQPEETKAEEQITTYCQEGDFRLCTIYDLKGSIAGVRTCINKIVDELNLKSEGMDLIKMGYTEETRFGTECYQNTIFFVGQDLLKAGGRAWNNETIEELWLQAGQEMIKVPDVQSGMKEQTGFVEQNCFPKMGKHFFWKSSPELKKEDFLPWFILYDVKPNDEGEHRLIGFGHIYFGKMANVVGVKNATAWMEIVPKPAIMAIAEDSPDWVGDYTDEHGTVSFHIYVNKNPWETKCGAFTTIKNVAKGVIKSVFG